MKKPLINLLIISLILLVIPGYVKAIVKLPALVSDGMVLQRDTKIICVKYAWADNPESANLYNLEGLPASPFEAKIDKLNY
jgi:hypothetical protein